METKTIPLTSSELGESGGITGYASTKNQIDSLGDMIVDGAYGDLKKFLKQGFVTVSHDTKSAPIGYILEAKEDAKGLWVKMAFHSTPAAQQVRTVLLERLKAGKDVGLSIGYLAKKWTFESFEGQRVRILREIELKEFSIVTMPAAPDATVISGKWDESHMLADLTILTTLEELHPSRLSRLNTKKSTHEFAH